MASLPPGTCSLCYGTQHLNDTAIPCPDCGPVAIDHAPGVPFEFHDAHFGNYDVEAGNRAALKAAQTFLAAPQRDLLLTGGVGAGKTRLACAIANESYRRGRRGQFVRVPMVLHRLQPHDREASDVREFERMLCTTPLLVMDDLGAERDQATDYTRRTLLMLYEERCDRGVRTVFTSNKSIDELAAMQDDDRLASRIAGRCDVIRLTTVDQRLVRRRAK
jgi:DNA replication protein DnaC